MQHYVSARDSWDQVNLMLHDSLAQEAVTANHYSRSYRHLHVQNTRGLGDRVAAVMIFTELNALSPCFLRACKSTRSERCTLLDSCLPS